MACLLLVVNITIICMYIYTIKNVKIVLVLRHNAVIFVLVDMHPCHNGI